MSVTTDLLAALKASQGGCSDYRLAKLLGVAQPTIHKYQNNQCPLSPEKIILACEIAGLSAVDWLLRLQLERARCDAEKEVWRSVQSRMAA